MGGASARNRAFENWTHQADLGAAGDDSTTTGLREAFWADRFARAREIFDRAVVRNELRDAAQAELAYEMLIGVLHFRVLSQRRALDDELVECIVDLVLDGVLRT